MTPHRPLVRYYGGKWHLAPWIVDAMPKHRVYTEAFAGGASVLLRKPRAAIEVLSDLDEDVVWLLRCAGHPIFHQTLALMADRTPYSRAAIDALQDVEPTDFVSRALRVVVRGAMTRSAAVTRSNGRPAGYREPKSFPTKRDVTEEWRNWSDSMPAFHARLAGVQVLHQPAIATLRQFDAADALHFVDPPYLPSARSAPEKGYVHDMSESDHVELLESLRNLAGMVILSGYDSALYRDGLPGWSRLERASTDAAGERRLEVVWLNPAAAAQSPALHQLPLFPTANAAVAA